MKRTTLYRVLLGIIVVAGAGLLVLPQLGIFADPPEQKKPDKAKGKKKHRNRLAKETSPYLLMHAHNPVNWFAWGPEAFAKAKNEGKLVFLSVGYSSCYWCHVMERESFDNEGVAEILNKSFVCIKVDREERPDVDNVYMTALTSAMGRRGGWPMSMFLTAEGKPFFGGTYWPREDKVIQGQKLMGFKTILKEILKVAKEKPKKLKEVSETVAKLTRQELDKPAPKVILFKLDQQIVDDAVEGLGLRFDSVHGGFGRPPAFRGSKFPTPTNLELLLHEAARTKKKETLEMVTLTLDKMAMGGIYDQLGGGFHRYSTERTWTIPHFEKMLYDNAQLVELYAKAYRLTKKPLYKRILQETLEYVRRQMTSPENALYSSQDAETDEEEGRFYVWTKKELEDALPDNKDLEFLKKVYGAEEGTNFENKYHILRLPRSFAETAKKMKMSESNLRKKLAPLKKKLFDIRSEREPPFLNKIALTSWSGLMIAGFAEAGQALMQPKYIKTAEAAADFVLKKQKTKDSRLWRTYGAAPGKKPKAAVPGYLEDYAGLVHGLLTLHDATGEKRWLNEAKTLTESMIKHHGDKEFGGFFFTSHDHEKLFARSKDQYDGAMPSANSLAARNLVRLWIVTGEERFRKEADRSFKAFALQLKSNPVALTTMVHALSLFNEHKDKLKNAKPNENPQVKTLELPGAGSKKKKGYPVKAKAIPGKIGNGGKQKVKVVLTIDKGWHVYANPVKNELLEPAATTVKVKSGKAKAKIAYPKGKLVEDKKVGNYMTYEGKTVINVELVRSSGPITLEVMFQACDERRCLVPKKAQLTVK